MRDCGGRIQGYQHHFESFLLTTGLDIFEGLYLISSDSEKQLKIR